MVSQTHVRQVSDKDFPTLKRYSLVVGRHNIFMVSQTM